MAAIVHTVRIKSMNILKMKSIANFAAARLTEGTVRTVRPENTVTVTAQTSVSGAVPRQPAVIVRTARMEITKSNCYHTARFLQAGGKKN